MATPRDQCNQHLACQPRERVVALECHSICKLIFTPRPSRCANGKPVYLHMGHLIDKGGYLSFRESVLRDVTLNPEAMVAERIYWAEDESVARLHLKSVR